MIEDSVPYYKQYMENGIRGGAVAGTFASVMFLLCLVQRFRYKESDRDSLCEYDLQRPTLCLQLNGLLVESDEMTSSSIQLITKSAENSMEILLEDDLSVSKQTCPTSDYTRTSDVGRKETTFITEENEEDTLDEVSTDITEEIEEESSDEESAKVLITAQVTDVEEVAKVLITASAKFPEKQKNAKVEEIIEESVECCEAVETNTDGTAVTDTTVDQVTRKNNNAETAVDEVGADKFVNEDSASDELGKEASEETGKPEPVKVGGCCCAPAKDNALLNQTSSVKDNAASNNIDAGQNNAAFQE